MNSISQTILGIVLVGTAFIFGSYLHRDSGSAEGTSNQLQDSEANTRYVWQDDLPRTGSQNHDQFSVGNSSVQAPAPSSVESTHQFRPLNNHQQQAQPGLVEANLVPDLTFDAGDELAIAEPDFSRYDIKDTIAPTEPIAPPQPIQRESRSKIATASDIATPDFGQHFPSEIRVNRNPNVDWSYSSSDSSSNGQGSEASLFRLRRPNMNLQNVSQQSVRPQTPLESQPYYDRRSPADPIPSQSANRTQPVDRTQSVNQTQSVNRTQSALNFRPGRIPQRANTIGSDNEFRPIERRRVATDNNPTRPHGSSDRNFDHHNVLPARNSGKVGIVPRERSPIMSDSARFETHQTSAGETLHDLAIKYYGDSAFYLDIYVANQDVLANPGRVPTGIVLRIPDYDQ